MGFCVDFFCNWYFNKLFLLQLFDIGNSAGSLINEAIGLFKTFQKISAPKSFQTRFTSEGEGAFSWAKDFIKSITNAFRVNPLTSFELFELYGYILPIIMLTFISALTEGYKFMLYLIVSILFLGFGTGISFIGENNYIAFPLIIFTGIIIVLGLFLKKYKIFQCFNVLEFFYDICKCKSGKAKVDNRYSDDEKQNENNEKQDKNKTKCCEYKNNVQFTYAVVATSIIFVAITIPIFRQRFPLQLLLILIFPPAIILIFLIDISDRCCCKKRQLHLTKISGKAICLVLNCVSLLIVPVTENFVKLMQDDYKSNWKCIIGYIAFGLIFPFIMTLMMILTNFYPICKKYNKPKRGHKNFFYYVELIDITKQIGYAILAVYDILWGCITIEMIWVLVVFIVFPYRDVSEYSLSFGNSLLILITNGVLLHGKKHGFHIFGFKTAIKFVVIACIPAVLSGYLYFIFDFKVKPEDKTHEFDDIDDSQLNSSEKEYKYGFVKDAIEKICYLSHSITPLAWFFYGLNMSTFTSQINLY